MMFFFFYRYEIIGRGHLFELEDRGCGGGGYGADGFVHCGPEMWEVRFEVCAGLKRDGALPSFLLSFSWFWRKGGRERVGEGLIA